MNIETAYTRFLQLVNGNMTGNNISVDKPRFVLLFNSSQIKFVENVLDKRNEDVIRYVSGLLVPDKKLGKVGDNKTHSSFELPKDYFDLASAYAEASLDGCVDKIDLYEAKSENLEEVLKDWSHRPSFKWREAPYLTASGNLLVYRDEFKVDKVYLTYYRNPKQVDIKGYTKIDKSASTSIDPELPDKAVEKILHMMAKELSANAGDGGQYQLDKDRLNTPT